MSLDLSNPFASRSTLEYEIPPFALIKDEHYLPAFYGGMQEQIVEIEVILNSGEPTFENTIVALEKSGQILSRVGMVFFNKTNSDTSPVIEEIKAEVEPKLTAHTDSIKLNPLLWSRIEELYIKRESLELSAEDNWILERYYRDFHFAGASLSQAQRKELSSINIRLSELQTEFALHLLNDTNNSAIIVDTLAELDGLTPNEIAAAKIGAEARGLPDKWLIDMVNYTGNPLLETLTYRPLRARIMHASLARSNRNNVDDTKKILIEMTALRAHRAALFGAKSHAEYIMREGTAKNPENVHTMLHQIAESVSVNAKAEGAVLQETITTSGEKFALESWDWDIYSAKVRAEKYSVDTAAVKPYFELEKVLWDGVFFAATKLFGITFKERSDLVTYHSEARAFEVFNEDGSKLGLFIGDFYTRDSKSGGAWMNNFVDQNFLFGQLPVVINNLNIPKPPAGEPTLLTFDS